MIDYHTIATRPTSSLTASAASAASAMNTFFFLAVLLVFCSAEQMTAKKFSTKTSSPIPELQEVFATVAADEFPFHKANTQPLAIYLNISTPQDCIHKIFRMTISFCSQVECQNMEGWF